MTHQKLIMSMVALSTRLAGLLCTWQENKWMDMSRSCFRSSPHHGRRANGALVMMVLSKGIERVNLDTMFEIASSVVQFGGRLAIF
ncbi:uncharacterized protein B0H64DRAFT_388120 [Chaetomium fimeti]|uniref:Secreted protein n=1 Tax=Chaetomium fimeti TaxID=1854472 RepID=A0AAE0HMM1_9PEZI|nr:hypothetical protein B0H64DRAFT_388120 [Chaetomium fimeti]